MKKIIWAGAGLIGAIAFVLFGKTMLSQGSAKEVDQAIAALAPYAEIEYQRVSTPLFSNSTTVKDVKITPEGSTQPIQVEEFVLYDIKENEDEIPTYIKMEINGVEIDQNALGENAVSFSELGYDGNLSANFAAEYVYEENDRTIELKQLTMGADDMGEFEMSLALANASLDPDTLASMPFSLFGMEFQRAAINYRDASFFDRLFESAAEQENISVKQAKEDAIAELEAAAESGELPISDDVLKELSDFIENPRRFSITFEPDQPLPLSSFVMMSESEDFLQQLNINFES